MFFLWIFFELLLWFFAGYWKPGDFDPNRVTGAMKGAVLLGFGEILWMSICGGIFVGGFGFYSSYKFYKHPLTIINKERKQRMNQEEDETGFVGENEFHIRGAKLRYGPWPELVEQAEQDAYKAGKILLKYFGLELKVKEPVKKGKQKKG